VILKINTYTHGTKRRARWHLC